MAQLGEPLWTPALVIDSATIETLLMLVNWRLILKFFVAIIVVVLSEDSST
jgi:hypothetical protein